MVAAWIVNAVTVVGSMVQYGAAQWMQYTAGQWYSMAMMGM